MNPDEMIRAAARVLDINFDPAYKDLIANELFAQLARENRQWAEKQGIGLESRLADPPYSIEEYIRREYAATCDVSMINRYLDEYRKRYLS
jgi:hypothetical protein